MKLKIRFFLTFSLLAVIPLALLTAIAYLQYYRVTEERMSDIISSQFENISQEALDSHDSAIQAMGLLTFYSQDQTSIYDILQNFARKDEPPTGYETYRASRELTSLCQNISYAYPFIYGVFVFSSEGELFGYDGKANAEITPGYSPVGADWYQDTLDMQGEIYISGIGCHPMFDMQMECIFLSQSLQDIHTHESLGVVVMACAPSLFDLSMGNVLGDSALVSLVNGKNGEELYSSHTAEETRDLTGQKDRALHAELEDTGLELTMVYDYDSLYREYHVTGYILLLFAVCCILLTVFLCWMISSSLITPVQELSGQMLRQRISRRVEGKDYSYRRDEIGVLYRQYYTMLDQLEASIKKDYQDKLILLDAQMKSLEARINSHFLFNTLESINSMAELEDNEQIATMSLALGNMFRYAIKTDSELVTLEQELANVRDYVSIQLIRFDGRFHLEEKIPEDCRGLRVLKLILQPLVENSLRHGLNYCTCGDRICISTCREEGGVQIIVEDNGEGMDAIQLGEVRKMLETEASFTELGHRDRQSIGLKNIQSRIELYYGKGYGLTVESQKGEGTAIRIWIPMFSQEKGEADVQISDY